MDSGLHVMSGSAGSAGSVSARPCVLIRPRSRPGAEEDSVTMSDLDSALRPGPQSPLTIAAGNTRGHEADREDTDMNMFDSGTSVYSIPFRDQGVKEDPGSDGAADTTSDSDTALNLASGNKHG